MIFIFSALAIFGGLGLFIEFSSPALMAAPEHSSNVTLMGSMLLLGILGAFGASLMPPGYPESYDTSTTYDRQPMERGYHIERICDQYQMTVGRRAFQKALDTGDYRYVGPGYDVETGRIYDDERLN